jgi:hypothetical protein
MNKAAIPTNATNLIVTTTQGTTSKQVTMNGWHSEQITGIDVMECELLV